MPEVKPSSLSDTELADWLSIRHTTEKSVVYVYAKYLFKVYEQSAEPSQLVVGDLGTATVSVLKKLSKANMLKRIELPCDELVESETSKPDWTLLDAKVKDITYLKKARDEPGYVDSGVFGCNEVKIGAKSGFLGFVQKLNFVSG